MFLNSRYFRKNVVLWFLSGWCMLWMNNIQSQEESVRMEKLGPYSFMMVDGWQFSADKSTSSQYVFEKSHAHITIKPTTTSVVSQQDINRVIISMTEGLKAQGEFISQRKPSSELAFLGQNQAYRLTIKSRNHQKRRFIYLPVVNGFLVEVHVDDSSSGMDPDRSVMYFLACTHLTGTAESTRAVLAAASKWRPSLSHDVVAGQESNNKAEPQISNNSGPDKEKENQISDIQEKEVPLEEDLVSQMNIPIETGHVIKKDMPLVRFSFSEPCDSGIKQDGMPWDSAEEGEDIVLPAGTSVVVPPAIPELSDLSEVQYRASVSLAFESMRLLYGPMPEEEFKKFESVWMPIFDYPTQEIIDHLNELNPLVNQFLSCREAYIRTLNDIYIVLLDAAYAVEMDEKDAWEIAMTEAGTYANVVKTLDQSMKFLAGKIEKLGNPPNPLAAKCEAQKRYKRALGQGFEFPFEGEITSEDGTVFYLKVVKAFQENLLYVYNYPYSWLAKQEGKGFDTSDIGLQDTEEGELAIIPGVFDLLLVFEELEPGVWVSSNIAGITDVFQAYILNEDGIQINTFVPPGETNNAKFTSVQAEITGPCPDPPPVVSTYNKSWAELLKEINETDWGSNVEKMYRERRSQNDPHIRYSTEWTLRKEKEIEYGERKKQLDKKLGWYGATEETRKIEHDKLYSEYAPYFDDSYNPDLADGAKVSDKEEKNEKIKDETEKANESNNLKKQQEAIQESIMFHTEMIQVIQHNVERDKQERDEVVQSIRNAKSIAERESIENRLKDLDWRIINHYSNIQHEQDMINSYKTGELVRTRTVFDDYAHQQFIENIRENAARIDATKKMAERMDNLIRLLPEEQQAKAREFARGQMDAQTLASGDIDKAKKIAGAIHNQVVGYAMESQAQADHDVITADQNELMAQSVIAVTGSVFMGLGAAQLASTYGTQAAATYYGTKAIGAIWGGTTGYLSGGPKEAVLGAMSYWSPLGTTTAQFIAGFENAAKQPHSDMSTRIWEGVKAAGTGYLMGKAIQLGAQITAKGAMVMCGENSRLFKPIAKTASQRTKDMLDQLRTQRNKLNAADEVKTFQKLETELALLKRDPFSNSQKIASLEKELNQLAAGLNMSYDAKWHLKYKAHPLVQSKFDRRVQASYKEMTPGLTNRMEQMGYDMNRIEFRPIRNSSSAGTPSMDLDFVPYNKGTNQQMKSPFIRKKDGSIVSLEQFQNDAQNSMNGEYRKMTGLSAPASDMQITTVAHKEAYTSAELLKADIDFSKVKKEDLKSVSRVLEFKMEGIDKKNMLTRTTKMQAKAREASKEIENMLLSKLRNDYKNAPAGSPKQKQIQSDINYWEDMLGKFKKIGTEETNPAELMRLNREIRHDTGGKDVNGVISDLISAFK